MPQSPTWLLCLATLGVLLSSRALPATAEYRIDPARTLVSFEVRYLGIARQRGTFNGAHGAVALDARAGRGHVDIVIDARSLEAASKAVEDFFSGRNLLDVEHYPEIRYRAERVVFAAGTPQRIEGELTLRGVKRAVPLRVTRYDCASSGDALRERCTMDATATFSRSAFGMTGYRTLTSDEVTLAIQAEGVR